MAIKLGTNNLRLYRRHLQGCTRYPVRSNQPLTDKPNTKEEEMADSCTCPIWAYGYLWDETHIVRGKTRPRRIKGFSLGAVTDWDLAERKRQILYERGRIAEVKYANEVMPLQATTELMKQLGISRALSVFSDELGRALKAAFDLGVRSGSARSTVGKQLPPRKS